MSTLERLDELDSIITDLMTSERPLRVKQIRIAHIRSELKKIREQLQLKD